MYNNSLKHFSKKLSKTFKKYVGGYISAISKRGSKSKFINYYNPSPKSSKKSIKKQKSKTQKLLPSFFPLILNR